MKALVKFVVLIALIVGLVLEYLKDINDIDSGWLGILGAVIALVAVIGLPVIALSKMDAGIARKSDEPTNYSSNKLEQFVTNFNYRWTAFALLILAAYVYLAVPVEPIQPKAFELKEVVGMPKYVSTNTTKSSGTAFMVNSIHMNCDIGSLSGHGGCEFFRQGVDLHKPARATYFCMPTRLWYCYKVLNSLEQDGRIIVSQEQMHQWIMRAYRNNWDSYYGFGMWLFIFQVVFFWFIERFNLIPSTAK
jgi:hypothetical protein